jgi:hypothetical protein
LYLEHLSVVQRSGRLSTEAEANVPPWTRDHDWKE